MTHNNSFTMSLITVASILVAVMSGFLISRAENPFRAIDNQLSLYPNIETVGVAASGLNLPQTAQLMYRQSGETSWHVGHPLVRIDDGRLIGSLFGLSPATPYEVRVMAGSTEMSGAVTTQPEELQFIPTNILHVNDDAPAGGDGSAAAPFQTIQEGVNHAGPGTQVLVADGIYREAVTFPASGNANQWIQVKAEASGAILDGSQTLSGKIWTAHPSRGRVWFMKLNSAIAYLARDGERFYKYDDLSGLNQSRGHGNVSINEGWYFDPNTLRLYIRSLDDPARHSWRVPFLTRVFDVNGRDWLWIEGFEMQFYGAATGGCGVCTLNSSHIVIRRNKIHNMQLGIFVNWNGAESQGNDTRIEYNEIYDPLVDEFPWQAVKGSSMEGTGIVLRGHIGAIVRHNDVHNFFNGIYTGSSGALENPAVAFDADIYNNYIHQISDDALEPEGACVNHRFRNNMIESSFVGVSLAPITQGPTWVLRSTFANYTSRSLKWALNSDGIVFIYHNASWTNKSNVNGMDLITPVHNSVMRNNIFQSTGYAFAEVPRGSLNNDWNNDNWYTTRATSGPHFRWESVNYNTISALCTASGLECSGYEDVPGFANPQSGNLTLLPSSPNIDRGVLIPGINDDFTGNAPDVGAYEFAFDPPPTILSIVRADANPTNAESVIFTVTFSEPVTGLDMAPPFNDFRLTASTGLIGASITSVTPVSGTTYTVGVVTSSGDGTLRLDVVDDDSIIDARGQPLGGAGVENGTFAAGEVYTIHRSATNTISVSFKSAAAYDGWVRESGENSSVGNQLDKNATTLNVGDDQRDRQYRGILSFDTSSLPDNAIIVSAELKVKRQSVVGTDPFGTHGA
ncbi:MAG: right-handed parallel beta-helix repeat-containing protein, partial [Anaerolineales bacterium]